METEDDNLFEKILSGELTSTEGLSTEQMLSIIESIGEVTGPGIESVDDIRKIIKRREALDDLLDD